MSLSECHAGHVLPSLCDLSEVTPTASTSSSAIKNLALLQSKGVNLTSDADVGCR
jgi:hypothetical protein